MTRSMEKGEGKMREVEEMREQADAKFYSAKGRKLFWIHEDA